MFMKDLIITTTTSTIIVLLVLIIISSSCVCGTLYGLNGDAQLSTIDPISYKSIKVGSPIPDGGVVGISSIDNKNGIFYFCNTQYEPLRHQLVGISVKSGSVVYLIYLPEYGDWVDYGTYLAVDPKTAEVVVVMTFIGFTNFVNQINILRINPQYNSTKLLNSYNDSIVFGHYAAYDSANEIVFVDAALPDGPIDQINAIIGYDAHTGEVVKTIVNTAMLYTLAWDSKTGRLYGIGWGADLSNGTRYDYYTVSYLDGKTGNFTLVSLLGDRQPYSYSALDPVGRSLFSYHIVDYNYDTYLLSINIDTGKVMNSVEAKYPGTVYGPQTLGYDER